MTACKDCDSLGRVDRLCYCGYQNKTTAGKIIEDILVRPAWCPKPDTEETKP